MQNRESPMWFVKICEDLRREQRAVQLSQARATFMEEVDLGMVEGGRSPNNKQPRDANANLKIYARIIGSHCSH